MKKLLPFFLLLLAQSIFAQHIFPDPIRPRRPIPRRPFNNMRNQPLATQQLKITGTMGFQVAQITYEQTFLNTTNRRIEGSYIFPIPKGMTISNFSMEIDGKPTNGELLDAIKARTIYEDIVRRQIDPAILEYQEGGLLKLRIFPIAPKAIRKITLKFEVELGKEGPLSALELPVPKTKISDFIVDLKITTAANIGNVTSPSHAVDIAYLSEKSVHASLEEKDLEGASKFQFLFGRKGQPVEANLLTYEDFSNDQFFQLLLSPGFAKEEEIIGKDISFALDASGSMRGKKMEQAKAALKYCINHLNKIDKFNIIRFSTEATPLFSERLAANPKNIQHALKWIEELKAAGGTNIYDALDLSLKNPAKKGRPEMVVFITDGRPTIGNTISEEITKMVDSKLKENARIFTFGVGDDLNIKLLDALTDHSNGYRTYVSEHENIALKVGDFYRKVASPVLSNLQIRTSNGLILSELQPKRLPDLFRGSTLALFGKYNTKGKFNIILTGSVNGKEKVFEYQFNPKSKASNDFIPRLWATRKVAYLYDQIRLNGESKEVKEELVATAKKYGIITPYTSYLIIEDEANLLRRGRIGMEETIWNRTDRSLPDAPAQETESQEQSVILQKRRVSSNYANSAADNKALGYTDNTGRQQNLANEVQFANGRAFYLQNNEWMDVLLLESKTKTQKIINIEYGSKAYIKLLAQTEFRPYLAVNQNVSFLHKGQQYNIKTR